MTIMKDVLLYIHGKGGNAAESEHYRALFPGCDVIGLDYHGNAPWEAGKEIQDAVKNLKTGYKNINLIANSIGAYFCMIAGIDTMLQKAYFISPIVNMEKLITDMMQWANVTEEDLKSEGIIRTAFGENLSWEYLRYVRDYPVSWTVTTQILYGSRDNMTSLKTIRDFAKNHNAMLTVMEGGEHWFHTDEQIQFLDVWIRRKEKAGC